MEFEGDKPISDAERQLAQTRQKTIVPLHNDIAPDALPDSVVVASHINGAAIGNVTGDIEQDAPLIHPANSITSAIAASNNKGRTIGATLIVVGCIAAAVVVTMTLQQ